MFLLCLLVLSASDGADTKAEYSEDKTVLKLVPHTYSGDFVVPSSVTTIGTGLSETESPFYYCRDNLNSISFETGSKVVKICPYCFYKSSIVSADMSQCLLLIEINNLDFSYCKQLSNVILPPNLQTIKYGAFFYCTSLKRIALPDSVVNIYPYDLVSKMRVFGNTGLEEIVITQNSKLEIIGNDAFHSSKLQSFYIPQNLTKVSPAAFANNPIEKFEIHPLNKNFRTDGTKIFSGDNNFTLFFISSIVTGSYIVPNYVTRIEDGAVRTGNLNEIIFHDDITYIGPWAFSSNKFTEIRFPPLLKSVPNSICNNCHQLITVYLTNNITAIEGGAFYQCSCLQNIVLPPNLTSIGYQAFYGCSQLTQLFLPENFASLGEGAFTGCSKLVLKSENPNIIVEGNNLLSDQGSTFFMYLGSVLTNITIPSSCRKISEGCFKSKKLDIVTFTDNDNISISKSAFEGSSVSSIDFPSGLSFVGESAFNNCKNLVRVKFSPGCVISSIPDYCFYNDVKLRSIVLPESVTSIGMYSFFNCICLEDIGLSHTILDSIGQFAFHKSSLPSANLPDTIKSIGVSAFKESSISSFRSSCSIPLECCMSCENLNNLVLVNNVEVIDISSFEGCTSLLRFDIPTSLRSIRVFAFRDCDILSTMNLAVGSSLTDIAGGSFYGCISLKSISVSSEDRQFRFENGALMNFEQTLLITFLPCSDVQNFVVPSDMVSIGSQAFMGSENLMRVMFTGIKITTIGYQAFKDCRRLVLIYFSSNSITTVDSEAFVGCVSLKRCGSVSVPSDRKHIFIDIGIPSYAFSTFCEDDMHISCKISQLIHISYLTPFIILFIN